MWKSIELFTEKLPFVFDYSEQRFWDRWLIDLAPELVSAKSVGVLLVEMT